MEGPAIPIASYATRAQANRAAGALQARGLRCRVHGSPGENGEWDVYLLDRIAQADSERHRRFLRAHVGEPASW